MLYISASSIRNEAKQPKPKPETIMKKGMLNTNTMFQMGSGINEEDVANFAGRKPTKKDVREYMKACIVTPDNGKMWTPDGDLVPIGNLTDAVDAAVRGYESNF